MRLWIAILLFLLLTLPAAAQEPDERPFIGYVPSWWQPGDDPLPVVILLHGAGGNGQAMAVFTNMHELAETEGFVVLFPDGVDSEWNDGFSFRPRPDIDDVEFIRTIIDSTAERVDIDRDRVYVAGFSNGGSMAYEVACNAPDLIAGIAVVAGMMGLHQLEDCAPDHPLPVIIIHGTEDTVIRFNRGMRDVDTAETITLSPSGAVDFWVEHNGCSSARRIVLLPDTDTTDRTRVRATLYTDCANNARVAFYEIIGGAHTWPGQSRQFTPAGAVSYDISANEVIWSFFVSTLESGDM